MLALLLAGCSSVGQPPNGSGGFTQPARSVFPTPDYVDNCAPVGIDTSSPCLRITLDAIDHARAKEGLRPMVLPVDFPRLSVPEQLFVAVDRERVDRGLAPFAGLTVALDAGAQKGADTAALPASPGAAYDSAYTEWIGDVDNGLDADFEWVYDDGPGSGVPGCSGDKTAGCWSDRHVVLGRLGSHPFVMGAAYDPNGDTSKEDRGGSSLAATLAATKNAGPYAYTWKQALKATAGGTLRPLRAIPSSESDTGVSDPPHNVLPAPDYTQDCFAGGVDNSPTCLGAVLAAINHAHALEGIRPMVLPADFAQLSVPDQLFIAVNLERVDRGLPAFGGLTTALDRNAQQGADTADDPPDPGRSYDLDDGEWAGGSSNGLDAVYGWMYDDGFDSGNLDCLHRAAAGCWGHRKGILDDFGSGPNLVMGAAISVTDDTHSGDKGGTSMAVTLAVADAPAQAFVYSWSAASASLPPAAA
ncbi:MAG TPA: hypothetical protein VH012_08970 [Acidimicrobiales bacterium]|nr:hypothetical protein [Acidimicrobiales bacterium]